MNGEFKRGDVVYLTGFPHVLMMVVGLNEGNGMLSVLYVNLKGTVKRDRFSSDLLTKRGTET